MHSNEEMKICSVIVTYGDRKNFLKEVINSCLKANIDRIVIVDNNSSIETKKYLNKMKNIYKEKINIISFEENEGSAKGFKEGFEKAKKIKDCDYILALDDDNIIPEDFKIKINALYTYLSEYKKDEIMLSMFRPIWEWDRKSVYEGWIKKYEANNFLGFNFLKKVKEKLNKVLNKKKEKFPLIPAEVSAMGGLLFHKSIIDKIGYPREDFYLYAEDHEFTYRFTKNGGKLFLCSEIEIKDIDKTFTKKDEKIHFFHKDFPVSKLYYLIRNHTYLSKKFIENKLYFYGNMIVYSISLIRFLFKTSPKNFVYRYALYIKAVRDGLKENLGKKDI